MLPMLLRKMNKAYLEPQDVQKLEEATSCLRDKLLVRLLFFLGCRVSEAISLSVENLDLDASRVTIKHLKCRLKLSCPHCEARLGRSHSFCPKCGKRVNEALSHQQEQQRFRDLPIDSTTLKLLKDYIHRGGPVVRDGKRLLFGINRHRAWQIVKECAERAGLQCS